MYKLIGLGLVLVVLVATNGCQFLHAESLTGGSSRCIRVYSATSWRVHQTIPGGLLGRDQVYDKEDLSDVRTGAGIAVMSEGRHFLVTASHVIGPAWVDGEALAQKWQGRTYLTGGSVRIRVSSLSYTPLRLYVDQMSDIAVLEMPADFWEKIDVRSFSLGTELPALEDRVKIWGFPQTSTPQLKSGAQVVRSTGEMLAFNEPLDGGYSGGPVLDKNDQLIGMVLRSTDRQSRAAPSSVIVRTLGDFENAPCRITNRWKSHSRPDVIVGNKMGNVETDPGDQDPGHKGPLSGSPEQDEICRRANLWLNRLVWPPAAVIGIAWTIWLCISTGWSWFLVLACTGVEAAYFIACLLMYTWFDMLVRLLAWALAGGSLHKSGAFVRAREGKDPDSGRILTAAGFLGAGIACLVVMHMNRK